MKIVIAGGSGQVGGSLTRGFHSRGDEVVILSRKASGKGPRTVVWDAETLGAWIDEIDGSDVVINLVGRSVNCRYTDENRREIIESRVNSTRVIGDAISRSPSPPKVWLQASTATIYAHTFGEANDDVTGVIGGSEPDAPDSWKFSIKVATEWEKAVEEAFTPKTRKVMLRSAITLGPEADGIFDTLLRLVRFGLGGTAASGQQYISWIHDQDFFDACLWLIQHEDLSGPINLAAPDPLPNAEFMRILREAWGASIGLPATTWMLSIAAVLMRTETELILKSRRVIPKLLTDSGFTFEFPDWPSAAADLCQRWRERR